MGQRGPRSNAELIRSHPPIDHSITPRAITIYRQMRKLDLSEGPGSDEWWDRTRVECRTAPYEFSSLRRPKLGTRLSATKSALLRFHELERASRKSPKRRKLYKWET